MQQKRHVKIAFFNKIGYNRSILYLQRKTMGEQEEMIKDIFKTGVQIIKEMKEKDQTTEETKEKEKT